MQFSHETRWTFHPGALYQGAWGLAEPFCSLLHPFMYPLGPWVCSPSALKDEVRAWWV